MMRIKDDDGVETRDTKHSTYKQPLGVLSVKAQCKESS
jgi:hypothetical protein